MSMKTCLMVGAGGMGGGWIQRLTENFGDRVKIVGLVDVVPQVLERQSKALGLDRSRCFTDVHHALEAVGADFCGVATPPPFHREAIIGAMEKGMPVICEKPIADTLHSARAVVRMAKKTGLPCAIIQNYRYARNKLELGRIRQEGRLGRFQHIVARYACNYRKHGSWGAAWRHDMEFGLLVEGSVHHFDMLRYLSGADCESLFGFGWNPEWSSFKHHSSGFYVMRMDNGTHGFYEGNSSAAGVTNCWHRECYRAEFEEGTVETVDENILHVYRTNQETQTLEAPPMRWEGHNYLFDEFLNWLDGGPPSVTRVEQNIKSFAMVMAAMDTTRDGQPRRISDYISDLDI